MEEMNYIREEGHPLANSTFIPNLIDDMALSVYAFRLYVRFKRRVNQNRDGSTKGVASESTRNLSRTCGMSAGQVTKAKRELVEAGLIIIKKATSKHGEYPHDEITIVDIWTANRIYYANPEKGEEYLFLKSPTGDTLHGKDARKLVREDDNLRTSIPDFIRSVTGHRSPGDTVRSQ